MRRLLERVLDTGRVVVDIVILFPARCWIPAIYGYLFDDDWT